jgi:ketosteroid isomerase-like protein
LGGGQGVWSDAPVAQRTHRRSPPARFEDWRHDCSQDRPHRSLGLPSPTPLAKNTNMKDAKTTIEQAYSAFNKRDIDGALALMTQDVSWPKASEGGRVVGKDAIRAYWTRQWGEFDPHVQPLAMTHEAGGKTRVRVRQLVKSVQGTILSDSEVLHVFTINGGLISAMNLGDEADPATDPSAAFVDRS